MLQSHARTCWHVRAHTHTHTLNILFVTCMDTHTHTHHNTHIHTNTLIHTLYLHLIHTQHNTVHTQTMHTHKHTHAHTVLVFDSHTTQHSAHTNNTHGSLLVFDSCDRHCLPDMLCMHKVDLKRQLQVRYPHNTTFDWFCHIHLIHVPYMQGMDMYLSELGKLHLLSKHKCHNHSAHGF